MARKLILVLALAALPGGAAVKSSRLVRREVSPNGDIVPSRSEDADAQYTNFADPSISGTSLINAAGLHGTDTCPKVTISEPVSTKPFTFFNLTHIKWKKTYKRWSWFKKVKKTIKVDVYVRTGLEVSAVVPEGTFGTKAPALTCDSQGCKMDKTSAGRKPKDALHAVDYLSESSPMDDRCSCMSQLMPSINITPPNNKIVIDIITRGSDLPGKFHDQIVILFSNMKRVEANSERILYKFKGQIRLELGQRTPFTFWFEVANEQDCYSRFTIRFKAEVSYSFRALWGLIKSKPLFKFNSGWKELAADVEGFPKMDDALLGGSPGAGAGGTTPGVPAGVATTAPAGAPKLPR